MISWMGNRLWLLALVALWCLAVSCGHAQAQTMRRDAPLVRTQFVKTADTVDPSTLTGKLIMGYQGWFNCPGDGTKVGWWHWYTGPDPTVDFLPNWLVLCSIAMVGGSPTIWSTSGLSIILKY